MNDFTVTNSQATDEIKKLYSGSPPPSVRIYVTPG